MVLTSSSYTVLSRGSIAPNFSLKGIDGNSYSLSDFASKKAILVIFMCNHCPYVQPKMDYFVDLQSRYGPSGLQIIGINSNDAEKYPEDNFEKMKEYAKKYGFNFPYLFDQTQQVAKSYGAVCTPDPFLLDSKHIVQYHGRFDDAHGKSHSKATTSEMEDALNAVLSASQVSVPSLPSMGCNIKWK
ncbi:thioredoxin family protein [Candidatus Micrarchaeota archaeon]|nr:thioredoxin family protein [Candidatus Micrarchaeota archaeon]